MYALLYENILNVHITKKQMKALASVSTSEKS